MFHDNREFCGFLVPTQYLSYVFLLGDQVLHSLNLSFFVAPFIPPTIM